MEWINNTASIVGIVSALCATIVWFVARRRIANSSKQSALDDQWLSVERVSFTKTSSDQIRLVEVRDPVLVARCERLVARGQIRKEVDGGYSIPR
jgi:hypothetical protein